MTGETAVIAWGGQYLEVAKNQYIISANAATAAALQQTLNAHGLHATNTVRLANNVFGINDTVDSVAQIQNWAATHKNIVTSLTPNEVYHKAASATEVNGAAWQYLNTVLAGSDVLGTTNGVNAWDFSTGKHSTIVAVLDTGLDITSTDIVGNFWTNSREVAGDTIDNDGNGVVDDVNGANFSGILAGTVPDGTITDGSGHGTQISTLIGGVPNNGGGVGVNWAIQILPVVVFTGAEETATDASIIAALDYVSALKRSGVNITAINMSFSRRYMGPAGGIGDPGNAQGATDANGNPAVDPPAINVFDAMGRATALGMIIVTAAGNGGTNDDVNYFVPANFKNSLSLTVAASTINDTLEPTSNYGVNTVRIAAPGSDIGIGANTYTGSSYAAALVTGAVALLKSFRPSLTPQQIVNAILNGADQVPALNGLVQGGRRLNILRAMETFIGNPAPLGYVDVFKSSGASGWLFDQNVGSASTGFVLIDGVQVQVNDLATGLVSDTFVANRPRSDLTAVVGSPNHGFNFTLGTTLTPGPHSIKLYINNAVVDSAGRFILNDDGTFKTTPYLIYQATLEGNQPPIGHVDVANYDLIYGWAADPNAGTSPILVQINVDGNFFATVTADRNHGDSVGNHAFVLSRPTINTLTDRNLTAPTPWLPSGAHRVDILALDDFTALPTVLLSTTIIGNRNPPLELGSLDPSNDFYSSANPSQYDPTTRTITGTVIDQDHPNDPISLQVTIDGANGARRYFSDAANHTYSIQLPQLSPGNHQVVVYAIDPDNGKGYEFYRFVVNPNSAPTGGLLRADANGIEGWVRDITTSALNISVSEELLYRVDIDDSQGHIRQAGLETVNGSPSDAYDFVEQIPLGGLPPGQHTATLWAFDHNSLEGFQVSTLNFTVPPAMGTPTGDVTQFGAGGIRGTAMDTGTANTPANVVVFANGDLVNPILTKQSSAQGNTFAFSRNEISAVLLSGHHYVQVFVQDVQDPSVYILLREGEIIQGSNVGTDYATIDYVDFRVVQGTAFGHANEIAPQYVVNVNPANNNNNADNWVQFRPTNGRFSVNTPEMPAINGNVVSIYYFNDISGNRTRISWHMPVGGGLTTTVNSKVIPPTPVDNFVNAKLYVTGNPPPVGNLDSASENGFSGWIIDPNAVTVAGPARLTATVRYRIDVDNIVGDVQTNASQERLDLRPFYFSDISHGFSIAPSSLKLLSPGSHVATLYAIDAQTNTASVVARRIFTVQDTANRKPAGNVETFTGSTISGWAHDATNLAQTTTVKVYVSNGTSPTTTFTTVANAVRADSRNGHGFTVNPTGISDGAHYVEVRVVDSTDPTKETVLRAGTLEFGTPQIAGYFDSVGFQTISGWANGPVNDLTPLFLVSLNGVTFASFTGGTQTTEGGVNIRRFNIPSPIFATTQTNTFKLFYVDPLTGQQSLLATNVRTPQAPVTGSVDGLTSTFVFGWVVSPVAPNEKVVVQILIDGVMAQTSLANQERSDLTGALAGHAFFINMPTLSPGVHTIGVRTLDPISGDPVNLVTQALVIT